MEGLDPYLKYVEAEVKTSLPGDGLPSSIEPLRYFLDLGGKRIRPILVLLGSECVGGKKEDSINQALAIELFHNFSLVHDDIMDKAPIRRGQPTVHEKWNQDVAILSGDLLLIQAYEHLTNGLNANRDLIYQLFNQTAKEVCYGQQLDLEFESRTKVSLEEYVEMISLKTSVLLGAAISIGALASGASADVAKLLYTFGKEIGIAFQINDDRLDLFSTHEKMGKQIGGDVLANKKTFLSLKTLELAADSQSAYDNLFNSTSDNKVTEVQDLMKSLNIEQEAEKAANLHYQNGLLALHEAKNLGIHIDTLEQLAKHLMAREY